MSELASPGRRVALAIDALRHGWPIVLDGVYTLLPAETGFAPGATSPRLLISAARAAALPTIPRALTQPDAPVLIRADEPFDLALARMIADPALASAYPLRGEFATETVAHPQAAIAALELARLAGVLPAFLVDPQGAGETSLVASGDLAAWRNPAHLTIAARAQLPIATCETAEIIAFRSADDLREHVALVVGRPGDSPPLVRIHSECLTGDVLGSLKCDCGAQLDAALDDMVATTRTGGWGMLLYLRQEGRGIGLINKLRAYQLQDQGFDTVDANTRLGLPAEARDFAIAARMLALLDVGAIHLLTNNPAKLSALAAAGVDVLQRVPHHLPPNRHNWRYLATKRDRAGHLL